MSMPKVDLDLIQKYRHRCGYALGAGASSKIGVAVSKPPNGWPARRFLGAAGFKDISIEPNEGSLRFFGQEALRFVLTTNPFKMELPFAIRFIWFPVWMVLLPLLGVVVPILCKFLDRFDRERRFTVGYHVTARRAVPASPS